MENNLAVNNAGKDYNRTSFWLETCGDDLTPRSRLDGSVEVDVAILGAGYSGLWTAYYLQERQPQLRIALVEAEIAGFGGSGRNGGWCTSGFSVSPSVLSERYGRDTARDMELAMFDTVDEVGRVCEREGIDAQYRKGGLLRLARGAHQLPANEAAYRDYLALGLESHCRLLSREETEARVRVANTYGSLCIDDAAAIHPGRLVRGLARVVEKRGATIYEQTPVTMYRGGSTPTLETPYGTVRASTIVLAGEAFMSHLPGLKRQITPIYSLIVLTEPLPEDVWQQIGWRGHECLHSNRYVVDYLSRTADNRIVFGSRGAPYRWGSRISDAQDRDARTHEMIRGLAREWFPVLRDARFTHAWGGAVGMPRDWMPTVTLDQRTNLATARGYTGQGVATTNLAGRLLAGQITGTDSALLRLPLAGHHSPNWEPEPLRWLSVRAMQWAFGRIDRKAERTGTPPTGKSLVERLGRH